MTLYHGLKPLALRYVPVSLAFFILMTGTSAPARDELAPGSISHFLAADSLLEKPTLLLAQVPTPSDSESDIPASGANSDMSTDASADEADDSDGASEYVFAGDLANTLRKIDPAAKVDWDGKKLRIRVKDQDFSIFPTGEDMVINGSIKSGLPSLKIRNGEIYVPQQAVSRIGTELEKAVAVPTTTPTATPDSATTASAATPIPEASPTPAADSGILPDGTPIPATPSPTPVPVLPDVTPAPTKAPTPSAISESPPVSAQSVATPFPQATPTPTPVPTPTPTPTPKPTATPKAGAAKERQSTLSTATFRAALQDKVSIGTRDIAVFNSTQLSEMASNRAVKKIIIHPDEGGIEREDEYGRQAARISMEIARRVKVQLQDAGFEVEMTRETEDPVTAGEALQDITRSKAQALLVISVGYSTSFQDLGGYRIFFMNETVDYNSLRDKSFDASEVVPSELNYKPFQNLSKVMASSLKNSINKALDRDPVGMNPAPLYFVRRAPMASTAVVTGYLSNPADAKRLTDPEQQDVMAKALVQGLKNYAQQVSQGKTRPEGGQ